MLPAASSLYTGNIRINGYYLKYKCIHHYEVAGTSGHYKQMKDLMASEIFVLIVKDWKLQSIASSHPKAAGLKEFSNCVNARTQVQPMPI